MSQGGVAPLFKIFLSTQNELIEAKKGVGGSVLYKNKQ
jgi:hypothetical protein